MRRAGAAALTLALLGAAPALSPADYRDDARALDHEIAAHYAYLDRFPGGAAPASYRLTAEREAVHDRDTLLHYAEDRLASLADHHAITGSSFKDSWAVVPTYADLWIVEDGKGFVVDAVRRGSPAAVADIRAGDRLLAVDGVPIAVAVTAFWAATARPVTADADAYAARVLAAGRRDRARRLRVAGPSGTREVTLRSMYAEPQPAPARPLSCLYLPPKHGLPGYAKLHFFNSLGDNATIAATDACLAKLSPGDAVDIDLTDTPSGGNTAVARAMIGWFVTKPSPYQVHNLPAEERETGVPRQWMEEVLPRLGKYHQGPLRIIVGRWTGSMGEGLAIGFAAIGAKVCGGPMAGLRGAVYDVALPHSGLVVKLPAERLYTVAGVPRETVVVPACRD